MRLPADVRRRTLARLTALGLTAALTGCGVIGGDGDRPSKLALAPAAPVANGPAADYPMVLGEPFTIAGELYTPADTMNYDQVGYAVPDPLGGSGVTAAHKTLPLPSYIELTSLENGKTILARVERRGPMSGALVALSPGAMAQLGAEATNAVRVRRVNPPEAERAELRAGRPAPDRLETPKSLVEVLRRKLPGGGAASSGIAPQPQQAMTQPRVQAVQQPAVQQRVVAAPPREPEPRKAVGTYPLPPLAAAPRTAVPARSASAPVRAQTQNPVATGDGYVVQAAAFSSKANAERAAGKLGGFVTPAGRLFRVRTGPYATRGQAEAALAKVRAAGYSDAQVITSG